MIEEINETISSLVDGELDNNETLDLLKKMQSDGVLKVKMCRYQAISQALKTDIFFQVQPDFSDRVFQQIQREPTYLLPQLNPKPPAQPQQGRYKRGKMLAIAASTVAAAVFVGQSIHDAPPGNNYQTIAATSIPAQALPTSLAKTEKPKQTNRQPLNAQFNEYLQAHNSSVYINGEANFQPYATVTSYGQR
jgi:sigma-E factor negative regulatory protein RseA